EYLASNDLVQNNTLSPTKQVPYNNPLLLFLFLGLDSLLRPPDSTRPLGAKEGFAPIKALRSRENAMEQQEPEVPPQYCQQSLAQPEVELTQLSVSPMQRLSEGILKSQQTQRSGLTNISRLEPWLLDLA
ncbi:hypothetical protein KI387_026772, partial [Taxus chinensis]